MHDAPGFPLRVAVVIFGAGLTLSCGEGPTAARFGPPAALQIVTGRSQVGGAGQLLPEPLTVQVLDAAGHGLPGLAVTWNVSGGGTLLMRGSSTVTDSAGLMLVLWQLGPAFGNQQVIAHCGGFDATFTALAQVPLSQRVGIVSGIDQQATVATSLTYPIVIQVLNADGTYDTGAAVLFRPVSGRSTYSPANSVTNSQGRASTIWTLGTVAGFESTAVLVRDLPPLFVTAYANPGPPVRIAITPRAFPSLGVIGDSVWVTAHVWDRYDNVRPESPAMGAADTTITHLAYVTYNAFGFQARHHGATYITAQLDTMRDSVPLTVLGFTGVSVGGSHVCGLSLAGDAYCWGEENASGSIGDGTTTTRPRPTLIGSGLGLQTPSTAWHTCALDASGHAYCWGLGQDGELGDGSPNYATELHQLSAVSVAGGHLFSSIRAGRSHTCAVAVSGDAYCWGANYSGQVGRDTLTNTCYGGTGPRCSDWPILVSGGLQFASITTSGAWEHSCGVTTGGDAYCWGLNASGQLGSDSAASTCSAAPCSFTPLRVEGGITFKSVSAGDYFSCGISTSGDGYCWGYGYYGQLGNGGFNNSTVPVKVAGGLSFADLQAGSNAACGISNVGKVYCWGWTSAAPREVTFPVPNLIFISLAVGTTGSATRACALTTDDDLYCFIAAVN